MGSSTGGTDMTLACAEMLMQSLGSTDWRVRDDVATELRESDIAAITPQLVEMLNSENVGKRNAAITALIKRGERSLPALHRAMESPDADIRNFAALALGHIADHRSADVLIEAFGAELDPNVRYHVVEAIGRVGNTSSVSFLVSLFREAEPCLAAAAIQACGSIRAAEAVEGLIPLLDDPILGPVAVHTLGDIGSPRALGSLLRCLNGSDVHPALRLAVAEAVAAVVEPLTRFHPEYAALLATQLTVPSGAPLAEVVERMLEPGSAEPRWVRLACWLGDPALAPVVIRYAVSPTLCPSIAEFVVGASATPFVEAAAASGDAAYRQAAARLVTEVPALGGSWIGRLLLDDDPDVRTAALRADAAMHGGAAAARLAEALSDADEGVRLAAREVLHSLPCRDQTLLVALTGDSRSLIRVTALDLLASVEGEPLDSSRLMALAGDQEASVRAAVARYLSARTLPRRWDIVSTLARDESIAVRAATPAALARFRHPDVPLLLVELLNDSSPEVRAAAADALEQAPGDRPKALLPGMLGDADARVVIAALGALGRSGLWTATASVIEHLGSEDPDVRAATLRALDRIEHRVAVDAALGLALEDESWSVRLAAVETLRDERDEPVRRTILSALDDESSEVRRAAIAALPGVLGPLTASHAVRFLAHDTLHGAAVSTLCTVGEHAVDAIERLIATAPLASLGPAMQVLALIGGPHAIALLESLLWHPLADVRWWVAVTLTAYPRQDLGEPLQEALCAEGDQDVRIALNAALDVL